MNEDFEDQLRRAIERDGVEVPADAEQAIRVGRRILRGRRLGWGLAACAVVAAATLVLPGVLQRPMLAVPAATAGPTSASPVPVDGRLVGTEWSVVKLQGADLVPGTSVTLQFGEGTVAGFGGCNRYGHGEVDGKVTAGWYSQDGDRLSIGPVAANAMGCVPAGITEQETRYFQALTAVQRFAIPGDSLTLFGADDTVLLELDRVPVKLDRTGWQVTSINGATPAAGGRVPTLLFRDGRILASNGCNGISGTYSQQGARVSLSGMAETLRLCQDPAVQQQENAFDDALDLVTRAVVEGGRLHLLDTTGSVQLEAIPDAALLLDADGFTWRLENKNGPSRITLVVGRDRLTGNSGCGNYTAGFTRNGDAWTIQEAKVVPVPCPSDAGVPASRFLSLPTKVTSVELGGDTQLRLVTPGETLFFTRK